jgi:hypothetical protein
MSGENSKYDRDYLAGSLRGIPVENSKEKKN